MQLQSVISAALTSLVSLPASDCYRPNMDDRSKVLSYGSQIPLYPPENFEFPPGNIHEA